MNVVQMPYRPPEHRFGLHVAMGPPGPTSLEVFDRTAGRRVARWRGRIAASLIQSDTVPPGYRDTGSYSCDKAFVRRLMLSAAAVALAEQIGGTRPVALREPRFRANGALPSWLHNRILRLLFDRPAHHFSENDIVCLILLESPGIDTVRIVTHLDDIVRWQLVQRIDIDEANVFYDIDRRPHLHVYDARRRVLTDAPESGCLKIST